MAGAASGGNFRFRRSQRLLKPAEFERLQASAASYRGGRRFLSIVMAARPDATAVGRANEGHPRAQVRFGVTVGRRNARLSVQRALVKRILREAMRHAAAELEAAANGQNIDLVVRLKAPFPKPEAMSMPVFKRALRAEADALLAGARARLATATGLPREAAKGAP
ncbi:MAG TPA: ribonuclease P protein component [Burkholderiaceae bacterium]|nr:ribonuclease P protein component [Burkholderiaceae bacterium]